MHAVKLTESRRSRHWSVRLLQNTGTSVQRASKARLHISVELHGSRAAGRRVTAVLLRAQVDRAGTAASVLGAATPCGHQLLADMH